MRPGAPSLKYARVERERRFLLGRAPDEATTPVRIRDRYIAGTGLRLRLVEQPDGALVRKLGHKIRLDEREPSTTAHTSFYLSEAEYVVLVSLPANELSKTRYALRTDGPATWSVDVFDGALEGLVTAELELDDGAALPGLPPGIVAEVTGDERYTGGALAALSRDQAAALVVGRASRRA